MDPRRRYMLYWTTQLVAWAVYVGSSVWWNYLLDNVRPDLLQVMVTIYVIGVLSSHALRHTIVRLRWLELPLGTLVPRLVLGTVLLGLVAALAEGICVQLFLPSYQSLFIDFLTFFEHWVNWTALLLLWSLSYLIYHYFAKNRLEEIRNLRLRSADRDNQLNNLRSQLNPHFMFNALNGIRALIDEDPAQAKRAITQLSAILRNAMSTVKRTTVPLGEEVDIVKAYLALEAMRFEERLRVQFSIPSELEREPVPPMLLQTLVENAVRHGIAKLTQGGDLHIEVRAEKEGLRLIVRNSGHYEPGTSEGSGIGLRNPQHRLDLIYGRHADLRIVNRDGMVVTEVFLPKGSTETLSTAHNAPQPEAL